MELEPSSASFEIGQNMFQQMTGSRANSSRERERHVGDEVVKVRLGGLVASLVLEAVLEYDVVPCALGDDLLHREAARLPRGRSGGALVVGVVRVRRVGGEEAVMLLQRAVGLHEASDADSPDSGGLEQRGQVLRGVHAEAVPEEKNAQLVRT